MAFLSSNQPNVVPAPTFISGGGYPDKYATDFAALESQKVFASKAAGFGQSGSGGTPFYGTSETGSINPNLSFSDKTIRNGFIRKVYLILMCQLSISAAFIAAFVYNEGLKNYARGNTSLLFIAFITTIVCLLAMSCFEGARRTAPANYIFLFVFTVAESFFLAVISTCYQANEVLLAVGICAVVCFTLTVFSFQTKIDFTRMGGILLVALIILLIFGFVVMLWPSNGARLAYACLGALLFSVYLVYDTQLLIGGDHKYSISPEDYVFAALTLYLDIIQLFLMILSIVGSRD